MALDNKTGKAYLALKEYPKDKRPKIVAEVMSAGHTNRSAALVLETTPGTIAGLRNKHGIPSLNTATRQKQGAREYPAAFSLRPLRRLAASEATQCLHVGEDNKQCGFERVPGRNYCSLHAPLHS
jgi:hypothetical protein